MEQAEYLQVILIFLKYDFTPCHNTRVIIRRIEEEKTKSETINVEAIFRENVFNDSVMKRRLPKSVYKKLKQTIEDGSELDPTIADVDCSMR